MTTATLISDTAAPASAEGASGSQPAADAGTAAAASAAAAPAASAEGAQTTPEAQAGDTAGAAGAEGGDKPAGQTAGAEGDQANGEGAPEGAPEAYADFQVPEGVSLADELVGDLKTLAKELNLPQTKAQALIDLGAKQAQAFAKGLQDQIAAARTDWAQQAQADAEIGGEKLTASLASAKKALGAFGSPALTKLLDDTGLGNHPEIIRAFYKAGAAISEDTLIPPGGGGGGADTSTDAGKARKLYPNQN